MTCHPGKTREKISRRKAALFDLQQKNLNGDLDKANRYLNKQLQITEELQGLQLQEKDLLDSRATLPSRITIEEMADEIRNNKLNMESKRFQNIIKMMCYRTETSCANLISTDYKKSVNEKRALIKSINGSHGKILPDYTNSTLTVTIYSQANPRMNQTLENTIEWINQTETKYPGTNLVLNYKFAT